MLSLDVRATGIQSSLDITCQQSPLEAACTCWFERPLASTRWSAKGQKPLTSRTCTSSVLASDNHSATCRYGLPLLQHRHKQVAVDPSFSAALLLRAKTSRAMTPVFYALDGHTVRHSTEGFGITQVLPEQGRGFRAFSAAVVAVRAQLMLAAEVLAWTFLDGRYYWLQALLSSPLVSRLSSHAQGCLLMTLPCQ